MVQVQHRPDLATRGKVRKLEVISIGWPKRCKLSRAFLWEHSGYQGLTFAQLLGQLGVFLT